MKQIIFTCCIFLTTLISQASSADSTLIKKHLNQLVLDTFRSFDRPVVLNRAADYIYSVFHSYTDSVQFQEYTANGIVYKNVIASFGTEHTKRIVVGAHYDVCQHKPGADDNASGMAALLELARMLQGQKPGYRIDLVAFTLEEPPYFNTELMGSYVHAKSLFESKANVYGMVCLEMIGYFSDAKKSQSFPAGILRLFYGNKGNFITLVKQLHSGGFARKYTRKYKRSHQIRSKKFTGPKWVTGVDLSDHKNYWNFGYSALMITDTSFYRNANYHRSTDTIETLDIGRLTKVTNGVFAALMAM